MTTEQTSKEASSPNQPVAPPKLFISYSWSGHAHEQAVIDLATEIRESGVNVILDKWDLKEGHDAIAFTHVLQKYVLPILMQKPHFAPVFSSMGMLWRTRFPGKVAKAVLREYTSLTWF